MSNEWTRSSVMTEFMKIAEEKGLIITDFKDKDYVGNPSKDTPVKDHRRYEPGEEYNITKEEGKDLVEKAHPKSPTMADAMGKGGLVENIVEQQERDIEIAIKMPNGALFGIHASVINELIKLASSLDESGKCEEAKRIDVTIGRISGLPFDKTAFAILPLLPLWAWLSGGVVGGTAVGAFSWIGQKISSRRESLAKDAKDLQEIFEKAVEKGSNSAKAVVSLLSPIVLALSSADLKDPKQFEKYAENVQTLANAMPKIEEVFAKTKIELGTGRWYHFGLDIVSRTEGKLSDIREGLRETVELIAKAKGLSTKTKTGETGIDALQQTLFEKGFGGKVWSGKVTGTLDESTIKAAAELEEMLNVAISAGNLGLEGTMKSKIIQDGKLIIDVQKLNKIIDLVERLPKNK